MRLDAVQNSRPKQSTHAPGNCRRDQPGVHHLDQIVVAQVPVRRLDHDGCLAGFFKRSVHLLQVFVIDGERIDIDLFTAKSFEGGDRTVLGCGDDDLGYIPPNRRENATRR
jgi:hypothetical protein